MNKKITQYIEYINQVIIDTDNNLYIDKRDNFLGCKFNKKDKYFIFFISTISDKITLSYRKNVNIKDINRVPINAVDPNILKTTIINIIEYNKNNLQDQIIEETNTERNYLTPERLKIIKEIETKINKEEITKKYSKTNLEEVPVSNRLYNGLKRNNINTLAELLLTSIEEISHYDFIGRKCLKELINIKLSLVFEGKTNFQDNKTNTIKTCLKTELNPNYYNITKNNYKELFTEEEYEQYLDFGIEIGNLTIAILKQNSTKRNNEIFKKRMNITSSKKNTLQDIATEYNITRERVRQIINKKNKHIKRYKYNYVELFNKIADKEILNYFIIGILYTYNKHFLEFILEILDQNIKKPVIEVIKCLLNLPGTDQELNQKMYNLINFPKLLNPNAKEKYDSLTTKRHVNLDNNAGITELEKMDTIVEYESFLEKEILSRLSKTEFVSDIKTQSLVITYQQEEQTYHYYPDIQLLTKDNQLVIIEVKPLYHMIDRKNLLKYQVLKKYCEKKGYGYAMIDERYNSIETILKHNVDSSISESFIFYLREKGKINYKEYRAFKETFLLTLEDLAKIVISNCDTIEFNHSPFYIKYIPKLEEE